MGSKSEEGFANMNEFTSNLAHLIEGMLSFRKSLGYKRITCEPHMLSFDRFCQANFPNETNLTKEMVLQWMAKRPNENVGGLRVRAGAIRHLGKYLAAQGFPSYVLPNKFIGGHSSFTPYIFTDNELKAIFTTADSLKERKGTLRHIILPVLLRLIYTCGLRPNEGRELKRCNVDFDTGVILITDTKVNKERIVVMSDDMLTLCKAYDARRFIFDSNTNECFFPAPNGGAYPTHWLAKEFKSCWIKANPGKTPGTLPFVRVYDLRHRFASAILNRWLDAKKNLNVMLPYLRAYMGHGEISATAYYIHILPENLVKSAGVNWSDLTELIPEVSV